jgi:hypothetical protein
MALRRRFPAIVFFHLLKVRAWCNNLPKRLQRFMLNNIFARSNLSSNSTPRRGRVTPVQLFFTFSSGDVSIEVLCLGWITHILLVFVQKIEPRLLSHLLHVSKALIRHSHIFKLVQSSRHDLGPLGRLRPSNLLGCPKFSYMLIVAFLWRLRSPLYSLIVCGFRILHISMLLLFL